ncbi:MAG: cardiolipin synthase A, partial [Blastopirellula sp.]
MSVLIFAFIQIAVIIRVLLRPHRDPSSRVAWIAVILALPGIGLIAYLLLGETFIGRKRIEQLNKVIADLPDITSLPGYDAPKLQ